MSIRRSGNAYNPLLPSAEQVCAMYMATKRAPRAFCWTRAKLARFPNDGNRYEGRPGRRCLAQDPRDADGIPLLPPLRG